MARLFVLVSVALSAVLHAQAGEPETGPVIEDDGPTYLIPESDVPLRKDFVYRTVFDMVTKPGKDDAPNRRLTDVARYMNMLARNGVEVENMDIAVVIHGRAMRSALSNEAHEDRYEVKNPSHDLLMELHRAGVKFYVCGQSLRFGRIDQEELAEPIRVGLSAMTILTELQIDGYALLP